MIFEYVDKRSANIMLLKFQPRRVITKMRTRSRTRPCFIDPRYKSRSVSFSSRKATLSRAGIFSASSYTGPFPIASIRQILHFCQFLSSPRARDAFTAEMRHKLPGLFKNCMTFPGIYVLVAYRVFPYHFLHFDAE